MKKTLTDGYRSWILVTCNDMNLAPTNSLITAADSSNVQVTR